MADPNGFNPGAVRLSTHLGTDLIVATCLQPRCEWTCLFAPGGQYLSKIVEVCSEHPCRLKAEVPQ